MSVTAPWRRQHRHLYARIAAAAALAATAWLAVAGGGPSHERYRQRCEAWVEQAYVDHRHVTTIYAYIEARTYRYRANYDVAPRVGFPIRIGLDCEIALASGQRTIDARERPFDHSPAAPEPASGRERALSYAGHACPRWAHWQRYSDARAASQADPPLPEPCVWLEAGTPVFGPIQAARYRGSDYVLIRVRDGPRYWIREAKL